MNQITVAMCQLESVRATAEDDTDPRPENLRRTLDAMRAAADEGAQLAVFGEIFLNGYGSEERAAKYAVLESDEDPWIQQIGQASKELGLTVIVGATTHKGTYPHEAYNSALVIDGSGLRGVYNKTHVPTMAGPGGTMVAERAWWAPGNTIAPIDTDLGRIGVEICYDIIFPEVARTLAVQGAELIVNISAAVCGFEATWDSMLPVRAMENVVPYVHVSIVGDQGDFSCFGGSRVYSATGDLIAELPRGQEATSVATIDRADTRLARSAVHTYTLRRPDLYSAIAQPAEASSKTNAHT